jgi:fatty acid desaturase
MKASAEVSLDGIREIVRRAPEYYSFKDQVTIAHLLTLLGVLALALAGATYNPWTLGLPAFIVIGTIQYHFAVAIHEASHFTLLSSRRLNEMIGNFIAFTIFLEVKSYRRFHMEHHKNYGEPADPDWNRYQINDSSFARLVASLFLDSTGYFAVRRFLQKTLEKRPNAGKSGSRPILTLAKIGGIQALLLSLFSLFGAWWLYPLFWVAPLVTVATFWNRIRQFGEHAGLPFLAESAPHLRHLAARTTASPRPGLLGALFRFESRLIGPFNFRFHHEHHLFPSIPYHHLPKLHQMLHSSGYYNGRPQNLGEAYLLSLMRVFAEPNRGSREAVCVGQSPPHNAARQNDL